MDMEAQKKFPVDQVTYRPINPNTVIRPGARDQVLAMYAFGRPMADLFASRKGEFSTDLLSGMNENFLEFVSRRYGILPEYAQDFCGVVLAKTNQVLNEFVDDIFPHNGKDIRPPEELTSVLSSSPAEAVYEWLRNPNNHRGYVLRQFMFMDIVAQLMKREEEYNFPKRIEKLRNSVRAIFDRDETGKPVERERYICSVHDNQTNEVLELSYLDEGQVEPGRCVTEMYHLKKFKMTTFQYTQPQSGEKVEVSISFRVKSLTSSVVKAVDKSLRGLQSESTINLPVDVSDTDGVAIVANLNDLSELEGIINDVRNSMMENYGDAIVDIVSKNDTLKGRSNQTQPRFARDIVIFKDGSSQEIMYYTTENYLNSKYGLGSPQEGETRKREAHHHYRLARIAEALRVLVPDEFLEQAQEVLMARALEVDEELRNEATYTPLDLSSDGFAEILNRFAQP